MNLLQEYLEELYEVRSSGTQLKKPLSSVCTTGGEIAGLLDVGRKIKVVSEAPVRKEPQTIAVIERADKKPHNLNDMAILNSGRGGYCYSDAHESDT